MPITPELAARLEHVSDLPSPPKLATEILALAENPDLSLITVAGVISRDPALAAKVLRTANSPLYARRRRVETLRQAMLTLGSHGTITLALSFSLLKSMRQDKCNGIDYGAFWRRSLLSASAARALADATGREDGDQLFLAALLQDIGILAIDKALPEFYTLAPDLLDHDVLAQYEQARLGCDHAAVSGWLLDRWNLPRQIRLGVQYSHKPRALEATDKHATFVRHIALSGTLADIWFKDETNEELRILAAQARELLALDFSQVTEALAVLRDQLPDTAALYETDLIDQQVSEALVARAQELVTVRNIKTARNAAQPPRCISIHDEHPFEQGRDPDNGLRNEACLRPYLDTELEAARRFNWPVSVACLRIDVDNVAVLASAISLLRQALRDSDEIGLLGQDDIVLILSGSPAEAAQRACQRIIELLRESAIDAGQGNTWLGLNATAGLATFDREHDFQRAENLLRAARRAMHAALRDEHSPIKCESDPQLPEDEGLLARVSGAANFFGS